MMDSTGMQESGFSDQILKSPNDILKLLNSIFNSSYDGICVNDSNGNVIAVNEESCKLCGVCKEEILGKNSENLVESGLYDHSVSLAVLKTKSQVSTLVFLNRTKKHILVTGTPIFDENNQIAMVVVNERDITKLNRLKKALKHTRMIKEKIQEELLASNMMELNKQKIISASQEMGEVLRIALKCSKMQVTNILILGESGTGKGLLAKYIHNNSKITKKPFIQINCATLPENLLEAELFGYEQGAFTGAMPGGKVGLFELANEGTLFLDEIGDLPLKVQAKLLKYLDDQEIMHLGGTKPIKITCAVIAATNRDLKVLAKNGEFRQDLYYRLNTFSIQIPPLRKRKEDIVSLIQFFLQNYNTVYNVNKRISPDIMRRLYLYDFPGNVRELKNIIHNSVIMSEANSLDDFILKSIEDNRTEEITKKRTIDNRSGVLKNQLLALEKNILRNAMKQCQTTREMAARIGISQSSLIRKLKTHGLS